MTVIQFMEQLVATHNASIRGCRMFNMSHAESPTMTVHTPTYMRNEMTKEMMSANGIDRDGVSAS